MKLKSAIIHFVLSLSIFPQEITFEKVNDDIIVFYNQGGTVSAIRSGSAILVVDTFVSPKAAEDAIKILHEHFPKERIKYVINTHHHADHIRGNQHLISASIIGHKNLPEAALNEHNLIMSVYGNFGNRISGIVDSIKNFSDSYSITRHKLKNNLKVWQRVKYLLDGYIFTIPEILVESDLDIFPGNKNIQIKHFGIAHTNNDLVVFNRADSLLIMGDLIFHRRAGILDERSDINNWISLLNYYISLTPGIKHVISGHTYSLLSIEALTEQRDYLEMVYKSAVKINKEQKSISDIMEQPELKRFTGYEYPDRISEDIMTCVKSLKGY